MASSMTEVANLGISHTGSGKTIANLDTEKSAEAAVCRTFLPQVIDEVLRDFSWPFATQFVTLPLVQTQPNNEWGYSYRYPSDCVFFRRILSGMRNDSRASRVPYRVGQDSQGKLIFCDIDSAAAEYTVRVLDVLRYPPDFVMAVSLKLAFYIAPSITAGDPFKMGDRAFKLYKLLIEDAKANAVNEEQVDQERDSSFIEGR
jgi:hypothetical protein